MDQAKQVFRTHPRVGAPSSRKVKLGHYPSFTPNNGIRISVLDCDDADEGALYAEFNLSIDQAKTLGEALIRWAEARAKMEAA